MQGNLGLLTCGKYMLCSETQYIRRSREKVKNEPFFKWPNKMAGDPRKRNQILYCQYHKEPGHITENCRNLK